jgi:di/tricarboxylate transporter
MNGETLITGLDLRRKNLIYFSGLRNSGVKTLANSIVLTDALVAPAFPSNTARGGVFFPIALSVAQGSGSRPEDPDRAGAGCALCA